MSQQPRSRTRSDRDDPQQRAAWFNNARRAPAGGPPRAWYYLRAWRHARSMPRLIPGRSRSATPHLSSLAGSWTYLGPTPQNDPQYGDVAGRVTALAVDSVKDPTGNTVYVGTAFGGVWESTDALSANPAFTPIGDTMPTLAVGAIALDSSTNPTTIYVGTGEPNGSGDSYYGVGILKSTDGGKTWTTSSSASQGEPFFGLTWSRILVDPTNPQIVLAAAAFSGTYVSEGGTPGKMGVFVSSDGGKTWVPELTGPACSDLVYDSKNHTYYTAFDGNGIWASSDQGSTWNQVQTPFANGVAPSDKNFARASLAVRNGVLTVLIAGPDDKPSTPTPCPATVTATTACDTGLAQSSDGGKTWTPIATPGVPPNTSANELFCSAPNVCQGNYDQYVAMPPNTNDLIIGGIDTWRLSGGSGLSATWTNLTQSYGNGTVHPDEHAFASTADGSHWFIGDDGGVWSTADQGAHWSDLNSSIGVIQFVSVSADLGQTGVYFGGSQDNGTAKSDPSNSSNPLLWNLLYGGDGGYTFDNPAQPQQYFTENPGFDIVSSNDGGQNFSTDVVNSSIIKDAAEFYVPYALTPDFSQMFVATNRVWRGPAQPTSAGQGWQAVSTDLTGNNCLPAGDIPVLSAIAVAPSDLNVVYVGADTGALALSTNATASKPDWKSLAGFSCEPVGAIAVDPTNPKIAYAVSQGFSPVLVYRVFDTIDGGVTWHDITGNLPNVPVNSIAIDPALPENIFVGTDTGVFASSGGRQTASNTVWDQLGTGLPATAVLQVKVAPENGHSLVVAATHGRGAWTSPAAAPPNFVMSSDQSSYTVPVSSPSFQFPLHVNLINGSSTAVQLSCSLPYSAGTCALSQSSVSASGDVTVTFTPPSDPTGSFELVFSGNDGTHQNYLNVEIDISDFQLQSPSQYFLNLEYGSSTPISFQIDSTYGWSSAVSLSCPGLPSGFTCAFSPASFPSIAVGGLPATVTLSASPTATATSPFKFTIAGTSGSLTRTEVVPINVAPFDLTLGATQGTAIASGTPFTTTVTAHSLTGSTASITLACQWLHLTGGQCAFNPPSIQPGQSSTATVSFPINSNPAALFTITGSSGSSDTTVGPVTVAVRNFYFDGYTSPYPLLVGASSFTGTMGFTSIGGYTTPISVSCTADQGVTCSTSQSSVSGTGTFGFTLSGLSQLAASTVLHVTFNASNTDITRQLTTDFQVIDFSLAPQQPTIFIMPGQGKGFDNLTVQLTGSTNPLLFTFQIGCSPNQSVTCQVSLNGPTATLVVDASQYLSGGGTLPLTVQLYVSATQAGDTITRSLSLPIQPADFSITPPASPVTVTAGKSVNFAVQLATNSGFNGFVTLTCSGAPAGATCKPMGSPPFVPSTPQLVVTTTARSQPEPASRHARSAATASFSPGNGGGPGNHDVAWICMALLLLLIAWLSAPGRRRAALPLAAGLLLLLALISCGGGGGSVSTPPPAGGGTGGGGGGGGSTPTGTPAGTSTLTITAAYSATSGGPVLLSRSTQVTLTVQ